MLQAIMGFLQRHGFHILLSGFIIFAVSVLFYTGNIMSHHLNPALKSVSFSGASVGFIIYAIGRILLHLERKKGKPGSSRDSNKDQV